MMNEIEAIKLAKQGREEGYKTLFENHANYLFTVALRKCSSKEHAEDLVQETFRQGFSGLSNFKGTSRLRTWLYTILVRTSMKLGSKKAKELPIIEDLAAEKDKDFKNLEVSHDVKLAFKKLSNEDCNILQMAYWDDLSVKEIAETLKISISNAKIKLFRARNRFSEAWLSQEKAEKYNEM
jgi:RNA polymerase sigma-70 factor (ECF subfamily)